MDQELVEIQPGKVFLAGIDVGSTTTKIAAVDPENGEVVYSDYRRHHANQVQSIIRVLEGFQEKFPGVKIEPALTGSGAKPIAEKLKIPFIQEVAANALALRKKYPSVRTAIELGGQDAKIIFFRKDEKTGDLNVADMRMNGSCAGGTGAFIDEVASILKVPVEELNALAEKGGFTYDISGRCGVYAKTDIQPLLNQGVARADLALSSFHAIAKQTIGGLAQGLEIRKPVAFEGGPLTFNPTLIQVFAKRLKLSGEDVIIPERPELMVAYGAAISLESMFENRKRILDTGELLETLRSPSFQAKSGQGEEARPFFASEEEKAAFEKRHEKASRQWKKPRPGEKVNVYLGIDSGSTTTKFVLMDEKEEILDSFYAPNEGEPLLVAKKAMIQMRDRYKKENIDLNILAVGTTGYGEQLFAKAFQAEYHTVETVAHARAAEKYVKDATFILDIGGQDMKAIWLDNGIITNILVNEACSSGCGSFLENFAASLHIPARKIAEAAFASKHPAKLGSRCTVFMNSSIITEQRNGRLPEDIMAGLCRSIIENVFTKVIRISNLDSLGERIVVQGGTFENDAVVRAMEEYTGRQVVRAPYPGLMGAVGVALIAKERHAREPEKRTFIDLDSLDDFSYTQESNAPCPFCTNHCRRTIVTFSNGNSWVTNNRCERGEVLGRPEDAQARKQLREKTQKVNRVPNMYRRREELLFKDYPCPEPAVKRDLTIGLPRVLSNWEFMPFWSTFWKALGYKVQLSDMSTRKMYESGLSAVTSDTVCFPAKLVHGHLRNLAAKKVDRIFMPAVTTIPTENTEKTSESMCAVVKGYPIVVKNSDNPKRQFGIPFDEPLFHWPSKEDRDRQLTIYMKEHFQIPEAETKKAIAAGEQAQESFRAELKRQGAAIIERVKEKGKFAVVLASRP